MSAEKTGTDNFEQLDFSPIQPKPINRKSWTVPPMPCAPALRGAILRAKLLHPDEKTTAPKALGAAKARDKRKGEL